MKKITFLLALGLFFFANQSTAQIRIVKADTSNGEITLKNFGGATVDITNYRLCARQTYTLAGDFTTLLVSGNLNLGANAEVTVDWNTLTGGTFQSVSDLGLYLPTGGFPLAATMVDFTQWGGTSVPGRESVAVSKGIWAAGEFILVDGSAYAYTGDNTGTQNGNSFWTTEDVLGIEDNAFSKELKIYPNPTNNQFSIASSSNINSVKIINLTGQLVKEINHDLYNIDVSDLSNGLYFIELTSNNQKGVKRLVIH